MQDMDQKLEVGHHISLVDRRACVVNIEAAHGICILEPLGTILTDWPSQNPIFVARHCRQSLHRIMCLSLFNHGAGGVHITPQTMVSAFLPFFGGRNRAT